MPPRRVRRHGWNARRATPMHSASPNCAAHGNASARTQHSPSMPPSLNPTSRPTQSMTDDRHLADRDARARILGDLETTLFVEAGAGSGKTTALVDRVVALVTSGVAELAHIAAITFTEKAGAELRDRIRRALEAR